MLVLGELICWRCAGGVEAGPMRTPASYLAVLLPMPFVAAALAYAAASLLHGRQPGPAFGALRGALVALVTALAYALLGAGLYGVLVTWRPLPAHAFDDQVWATALFSFDPISFLAAALIAGIVAGDWREHGAQAPANSLGSEAAAASATATAARLAPFVALVFVAAFATALPLAALLVRDGGRSLPAGTLAAVLVALAAVGWTRVVVGRDGRDRLGARTGIAIALLAYVSFFALILPLVELALPHRRTAPSFFLESWGLGATSFLLTPFPWLVMLVGAGLGLIPVAPLVAAVRAVAELGARAAAAVAGRWRTLALAVAAPRRERAVVVAIGAGTFLAAACLAFLVARQGPASSGLYDDPMVLLFPALAAVAVGVLARLATVHVMARLAPRWRLQALLATGLAALAASVAFWCQVA